MSATAVHPLDPSPRVEPARAATPPTPGGPGISAQNTRLPTAPLSAHLPRIEGKVMMADDGTWVTGVPIGRHRAGAGQVEVPADGSVNLLEAVIRTRAHAAYRRILENCSPAEPFAGDV